MGFEGRTCWLVRPPTATRYAVDFVTRGVVSIGWDLSRIADLRETSDPEVYWILEAGGRRKPEDDVVMLRMFTDRLSLGDVIVVPDQPARDFLFGEVRGPYDYAGATTGGPHRHVREVRWFGRLREDQVEPLLVTGAHKVTKPLRRLPEQTHWQRLAGEVEDFLGRPPDDVPKGIVKTSRPTSPSRTPRVAAAAKPAGVPDRLCPSCGLLRSPTLFDEGDDYCRDCA